MAPLQREPLEDNRSIDRLSAALEAASGCDRGIDALIVELFQVEPAEFTSDAAASRRLCGQLLPDWQLRVGYDVCGILPCATLSRGSSRHSAVAPTVPLAILRVMMCAVMDLRL